MSDFKKPYNKRPGSGRDKPFSESTGPGRGKPFTKPAGPGREKPFSESAGPGRGKPFAKPAGPEREKPFAKPAGPGREKPFSGSAAPGRGKPFAKPAGPEQEKPFSESAGPGRNKPFTKSPASGQDRSFAKSTGPGRNKPFATPAGPEREKPFAKPAGPGREKPFSGSAAPGRGKPFAKPAGPEQEKPFSESAGPGRNKPFTKSPASGQDRSFAKSAAPGRGKPFAKPAGPGREKPFSESAVPEQDRPPFQHPPEPLRASMPEDELPNIIMGRNPVREAIKSARSIDRILVAKDGDGSLREIVNLARDAKVRIEEVDRSRLDALCMPYGHGERTGNHQGIVAYVPGVEYCELSDILEVAKEKGEPPFIILLDGIEDPHNLGSIIRSAECAGAHGVVITKRRSAQLTASACKASAGAVEYIKVARVTNLAGAIDRLKDEGLWIAGADMQGTPMHEASLKGALGLVIGGEGEGMGRLVREKCDYLVSIPIHGRISSLNASVAAAILMFEKHRQG